MDFNWFVVMKYWPGILEGFKITLIYFSLSALLSVLVGIIVASLGAFDILPLTAFRRVYVTTFRDLPLLVLLFFLFYGLPYLGINIPIFLTGILGITLNESAYMAEIFRGSLQSIREEDWEAGYSLALSKFQVIRYVIMPQTIRDALPAITGQVSIVLKDTSLLALIMISDLTHIAKRIYTLESDTTGFFVAAVLYIGLYWTLDNFSQVLEEKVRVKR